jgi:hypothetical protein
MVKRPMVWMTRRAQLLHLSAAIAASVMAACSSSPAGPTTTGTGTPSATGGTAVMLGVGDIGMCNRPAVAQTARLVAGLEGDLLLAGDIAYFQGTAANFRDCFNPEWGRFRDRWHATPGNHEYESAGAGPYFDYFGDAAGADRSGFYAFMAGDWLILMLNSNIAAGRGSEQWEFARRQLEAQRTPCTMAVWHHPLFSSGPNGNATFMRDMWSLLEASRVEVVLNGHDHLYERFARQRADGTPDPTNGIRQFTAGTGGAELYNFVRAAPNSESRVLQYGVIRFTLRPALVEWAFLGIDGSVNDSGLDTCR